MKNLHASAAATGVAVSIPGSRRTPGGGNGTPLQYTCLENSMDRGVWWATVYKVRKANVTEHANTLEKANNLIEVFYY